MWDDYDNHEKVWTDIAQICLNGHVINDSFKKSPQLNKDHCPKCGGKTLTECPECHRSIAGEIHYPNVWGAHEFRLPSYCIECGKPYPWTLAGIKAAKELASELEELTPEEKILFEKSIDEISKDNAQATVGATRIKKIMMKVGASTGGILKEVITDVASETAKKVLFGK